MTMPHIRGILSLSAAFAAIECAANAADDRDATVMKRRSIPPTSPVPTDVLERRAWFYVQLTQRGLNTATLAETLGCDRRMISQCLIAPKSDRLETGMAEAIGLTVQTLFPERHAIDGTRLYRTVATKRAA